MIQSVQEFREILVAVSKFWWCRKDYFLCQRNKEVKQWVSSKKNKLYLTKLDLEMFFVLTPLKHHWHHHWGTAKMIMFCSAVVVFSTFPWLFSRAHFGKWSIMQWKSTCFFYLSLTLTSTLGSLKHQNLSWSRSSSKLPLSFCTGREGTVLLCMNLQVLILETTQTS